MKRIWKISGLKLNTHKISILNPGIHRINTHNNNTLNPWGVEILEAEDKEEDLVVEEDKLYVIIVGNHDILPGTVQVLQIHVRIAKLLIIASNNVRSWLWSGRI